MATYAIGDLQGCFTELGDLLDLVNFDQSNDRLWFCGDLINRGPQSLQTIQFVRQLGNNAITVLGNHDLHLLAVNHQSQNKKKKDSFDDILSANNKNELLDWLKHRKLFHRDEDLGYTLIHAGVPPQWTIKQTETHANEIELLLQSTQLNSFLDVIYGDEPDQWNDNLEGFDRYRYIVNCLTRLRYCYPSGQISLDHKGPPGTEPEDLQPWFCHANRKTGNEKILFGHWSTVRLGNIKNFDEYNVYPLDTGCVWGGELSALRLEDETWFKVTSKQPREFNK